MAEYIEREYLLYKFIEIMPEMGVDELADEIYDIALNVEAADVVPVKHGKWILQREPDGTPYCFHCSICDDDFHRIGVRTTHNYCPHCGARMDAKKEG